MSSIKSYRYKFSQKPDFFLIISTSMLLFLVLFYIMLSLSLLKLYLEIERTLGLLIFHKNKFYSAFDLNCPTLFYMPLKCIYYNIEVLATETYRAGHCCTSGLRTYVFLFRQKIMLIKLSLSFLSLSFKTSKVSMLTKRKVSTSQKSFYDANMSIDLRISYQWLPVIKSYIDS